MGRPPSVKAFQPPQIVATKPKELTEMHLEELKAVNRLEFTEDEHALCDKLIAKLSPQPAKVPKPAKTPLEESRSVLNHPCPPGMQYYESPEGFIMVAEAGKDHVWCRQANGGKGMKINPLRRGNPKGEDKIASKEKLKRIP